MNDKRIVLHADLNSFFAMAEQQANPLLRKKPVGIVKAKGRTCIIAASVEAKKYGVVTGCRVGDAKKLCPDIILVPADFAKYEYLSYRFINLCRQFSDNCEVFSLDECFLDVTESQKFFLKSPKRISHENKLRVLDQSDLMDVCGLGFGLYKHLKALGINSFEQIRSLPLSYLHD